MDWIRTLYTFHGEEIIKLCKGDGQLNGAQRYKKKDAAKRKSLLLNRDDHKTRYIGLGQTPMEIKPSFTSNF